MRTIHKFPFNIELRMELLLPVGAIIRLVECQVIELPTVGVVSRTPTMWVELETENPTEWRVFYIMATGGDIPPDLSYVASFQQGQFVWHLYERKGLGL